MKKRPPQKIEPEEYQMPEVKVGDMIVWSPDQNGQECPAIVTKRSTRSLDCAIILPGTLGYDIRDAVRHVSDPDIKPEDVIDNGCWKYGPQHHRLRELEDKIEKLFLMLSGDPGHQQGKPSGSEKLDEV